MPVMISGELWRLSFGLDWGFLFIVVTDFHLRPIVLDDVRAVSITSKTMMLPVCACIKLLLNLVNISFTLVFREWRSHEPVPSRLRNNVEASEAQGRDYEQGGESFLGRTSVDGSLRHVSEDAEVGYDQ